MTDAAVNASRVNPSVTPTTYTPMVSLWNKATRSRMTASLHVHQREGHRVFSIAPVIRRLHAYPQQFCASADASGMGPHFAPRCIVRHCRSLNAGHSGNPALGFPVVA